MAGAVVRVKSLYLAGFKSFVDRTDLVFDPGVTAIVGPNGSGKSNIVDAFLWVLGEQNPRRIRAATTADLIFAGSAKRRQTGMAEVRLTIDNEDQSLPIGFAEVAIARRVYRSGESQFLINGAPARLRDLADLFLDTGAGRGAYSIVSQTEIDAVLSYDGDQRKALFEEAAGIKKYRTRKREALRKLETAEANLTRITDILLEISVQVEALRDQAARAKLYEELVDQLRTNEVGMLAAELLRASSDLENTRHEYEEARQTLRAAEVEAARVKQQSASNDQLLREAESAAEQAANQYHAGRAELARLTSELTLCTERGTGRANEHARLQRDEAELAVLATAAEARIRGVTEATEAGSAELVGLRDQEAVIAEELKQTESAVQSLLAAQARARALREEALRMAAARAERLTSARKRLVELRDEIDSAGKTLERTAAALASTSARRDAAAERVTFLEREIAANAQAVEAAAAERDRCAVRVTAAEEALDEVRRCSATAAARAAALNDLERRHEGYYQGVKSVLLAVEEGTLTGHYRTVADVLQAPESLRIAVEVALGSAAQDLITNTEAEAAAAINWLKTTGRGRATFLPLPLMRPPDRCSSSETLGSRAELLADCVQTDARYQPAIDLLLNRALVVSNLEDAMDVSQYATGWSKIVTQAGELLTRGGAVTGGSLQGRGTHLIGRRGELNDLQRALPKLAAQEAGATQVLRTVQAELAAAAVVLGAAENDLAATRTALQFTESARAEAESQAEAFVRSDGEAHLRHQRLQSQADELEKSVIDLQTEATATENNSDDAEGFAVSEASDARDRARRQLASIHARVALVEERLGAARREMSDASTTLANVRAREQQRAREASGVAARSAELAKAAAELTILEQAASESFARAQQSLELATERRDTLRQNNADSLSSTESALATVASAERALHGIEMRAARIEAQQAQAIARLREEYGIDPDTALQSDQAGAIDRATTAEVSRLRREIRAMGLVNTGAIEEFNRLEERRTFLESQRVDLESGRDSVRATISEIDRTTAGVFEETVTAVQAEFQRLFQRLFDGGSAQIVRVGGDPAEPNIEITVTPPGKKVQPLEALSGGERALTAAALLFALHAVRPSPFVILDEVDAPLDGANVEKYVALVEEFSRRSQIIAITHNPTTMEKAPAWHGVTMREPGVSSVISYQPALLATK
ncbi:MAG: chromosome segregation protein SMC [Armatimonadetes bacterium]|nr:chromosome segregation protein SMC [Armatimonadota bacterium]MDE2206842.1 chromosome segregation protein SMC [Armatimonadota bacterium]